MLKKKLLAGLFCLAVLLVWVGGSRLQDWLRLSWSFRG